ncbi:MAG: GNAT family N-acetyltransferase [Planctomycetota bacterium]
MSRFRLVTDPAECQDLWDRMIPPESVFDLWEVRACFHRHFRRPPCFIVTDDEHSPAGLLPLSWIGESESYGCFPGETWRGKTWLEQNRIVAGDADTLIGLLDRCPGPYHLRYLRPLDVTSAAQYGIDETGYLFRPPNYNYDLSNYFLMFSHKSAKRLRKELNEMEGRGVRYRHEDLADFDRLVEMNVGRFGEGSYFSDPRFLESFRGLLHLLHERGWLRLTAVFIGGEPAAIDIGCVYRDTYTLLGGGTDAACPGVAKLINIHHMRRACAERLDEVDFLCGDFSWKTMFHLTPRPLYLLSNVTAPQRAAEKTGSEALVQ